MMQVDENLMQRFYQAYYDRRQFALVHLSLGEVAAFVHQRIL